MIVASVGAGGSTQRSLKFLLELRERRERRERVLHTVEVSDVSGGGRTARVGRGVVR